VRKDTDADTDLATGESLDFPDPRKPSDLTLAMNPYQHSAAGWQYGYQAAAMGAPAANTSANAYAASYYAATPNTAAAAAAQRYSYPAAAAAATHQPVAQHHQPAYAAQTAAAPPPQHRPSPTITTIHPSAPPPATTASAVASAAAAAARGGVASAAAGGVKQAASWQQIKQAQGVTQAPKTTIAAATVKPYYPTKQFVKASSTPAVGGNGANAAPAATTSSSTASTSGTAEDEAMVCMKLHEVAVLNKIVETYERIANEVAPGIHGVRLKFGTEVYTGTGPNFKAAKQNAAAAAMAQTKYAKPVEKKTMRVRPVGITATQELHELATKKGTEARFRFLEPANFEFKAAMRMWSKEEMRGNYRVQLTVNGFEYYGQADLPQQAKHNAAMQALPMLNRLPDAASASKVSVVIPSVKAEGANGGAAGGGGGASAGEGGEGGSTVKNVIMILNEIAMAQSQCMEWNMVREDGPPHARRFTWSLKMGDYETEGVGHSKKIAKSLAAQAMYEKIPAEWKSVANGGSGGGGGGGSAGNKFNKRRKPNNKPRKRKAGEESAAAAGAGAKKAKDATESATPKPAYSVIQATNPISALYEYCRKIKTSDPDFECVSENVLETWQKDNHTFKKTEYTLKLQVNGKLFYGTANTKKAAKTTVATEAWNVLRVENI